MSRDQALGLALIIAGLIVPAVAIAVAQARDTIRHAAARCGLDADRTPSPAEVANALAIRDAEESWVRLTCAECGRTDCTHGAVALEEAARQAEVDWTEWEREVTR